MISAIILAGGKGKRMRSAISKQFIDIKGKPIIYYTLKKFSENKKIDNIIVVLPEDEVKYFKENILKKYINKIREDYDYILIGANKEEAGTFSDNTQTFVDRVNAEFEYSTNKRPKVVAPLINYDKNDIVKLALKNNIPLNLVKSCYAGGEKHCGKCESCIRLKNALMFNHADKYIEELF